MIRNLKKLKTLKIDKSFEINLQIANLFKRNLKNLLHLEIDGTFKDVKKVLLNMELDTQIIG